MLGAARHAPRGEDVDEADLARESAVGKPVAAAGQRRQVELRRRLVDQRRRQHHRVDAEPDIERRRRAAPKTTTGEQVGPAQPPHSAACAAGGDRARGAGAGAPTRWRRSVSDTSPPNAMTSRAEPDPRHQRVVVEAQRVAALAVGVADHGVEVGEQVGADRDLGRGAVLDRIEALLRMHLGDQLAVAQQRAYRRAVAV